jgi:hypothetical protein
MKKGKKCKFKCYTNRESISTFRPSRTRSYASDFRSMQFNVKPFIDKVSENQKIQNSKKKDRMKECTEI